MRLLFVEDRQHYADAVSAALAEEGIEITHVRSRDGALEALLVRQFDLIVCDLDIPPRDGVLASALDHGEMVRQEAEARCPGTPLIVHSGIGTADYVADRLDGVKTEDVFGDGRQIPLHAYVPKSKTPALIQRILEVRDHLRQLESIEIQGPDRERLPWEGIRALRIYARRRGGMLIRVWPLAGGLSDATVMRIRVEGERGALVASVVGKVDGIDAVRSEFDRYHEHVAPLLGAGAFAPYHDRVSSGCGMKGGIFYTVAETFGRSLFSVVQEDPAEGARVILRVAERSKSWVEGAPRDTASVRDVRRVLLADDEWGSLANQIPLNLSGFEDSVVNVHRCVQHCDLHGENVLVNMDCQPMIIDYGEVRPAYGGVDPMTLELGFIFHPAGRSGSGGWPTIEQARGWIEDLDRYVEGCRAAAAIMACREWTKSVGPGNRAGLAAAYAYLMRQLKYEDTRREVIGPMIKAIVDAW